MKNIKIKEIEIYYDDKQNIEYIKNIILNNYNLILSVIGENKNISLVPTNDDRKVYISNFDEFFYEIVNIFFDKEGNDTLLKDYDLLPALYIETLIREKANDEISVLQQTPDVSNEILYSTIAYIYFMKNESFDDFVNYLKHKKETSKIIKWLQNEIRFDAYNYLLESIVNYLKQNDFEYLNNITNITNIMLDQSITNVSNHQEEKEINLPKITIKELEKLFEEFLIKINAPESWKKLYDELKLNNKIIYEKQEDAIDKSMCYVDDNNVLKILISTDGTIKSFCSFVHEFVHYITMFDSLTLTQFSISEFPSIFFEKLAANFLKQKGYAEDIVNEIIKIRNKNNIEIYIGIASLFNDVSAYIKSGPITKEKKVLFWEENFKIIQKTKEKLAKIIEETGEVVDKEFLSSPDIDISSEIDKECDFLINSYIENGLLIINGYQYLLDTYLAEEVLKRTINDNSVISRMIDITNNLSNLNLKCILKEFDIQSLTDETKRKK